MKSEEPEPTRDELLAMAYADGELPAAERVAFEERMANESALRLEVTELQKLDLIARQMAPREPMDYEWESIEQGLVHRAGLGIGFLALLLGAIGIMAWVAWDLARSDVGLVPKILVFLVLGGLLLVFLIVLRNRLRTIPHDPYTEVQR